MYEWTSAFNTATQNAAGSVNMLLPHTVGQMNQIAQTATHVETIWTSTFERAASAISAAVKSAESRVVNSMNKIANAAKQAAGAVEDLKSAIDSLKDKTVTITTVFVTRRVTLQHGGSIITTKERKIGPATISEFNKPELVTVTPLSNPNDINDRSIRLDAGGIQPRQRRQSRPIVIDTGGGGGNGNGGFGFGGRPPKIVNKIATTVNLDVDGRRLAKRVIPFELENADAFYV